MSLFSFFRKNRQETPDEGVSHTRVKDEPNPKRTRAKRKAAADNESGDPVLPEKKRARRRLIGAIALVLAAVIGLPMVLDSEPKPLAQDIDITIPSRDPAAKPRRQPAEAAPEPAEEVIEPVSDTAPAATTAADAGKPAQQPAAPKAVAAEPKPAEAKVVARTDTKRAEAKPAARPEDGAAARSEAKPQPADDREAARARAILEGKSAPAADSKPSRYMVQVAALSSQEKITELRGKLKSAGIASQTQKVPSAGGERTRVRVGPFGSREEAEKMRARLVKLGLNGSLVPLDE